MGASTYDVHTLGSDRLAKREMVLGGYVSEPGTQMGQWRGPKLEDVVSGCSPKRPSQAFLAIVLDNLWIFRDYLC